MNINIEVYCDECGREGFHGSFYSKKEVYDELKKEGWTMKRKGWETQPWTFHCPDCKGDHKDDK